MHVATPMLAPLTLNRNYRVERWVAMHIAIPMLALLTLSINYRVERWVAIDDAPLHKLGAGYVRSNSATGISDKEVHKSIALLNS